MNSDCSLNQACMREKCKDPCPGSCGTFAQCTVMNHVPICSCIEGYTGDPFTNCYPRPLSRETLIFYIQFYKIFHISYFIFLTFRTNIF